MKIYTFVFISLILTQNIYCQNPQYSESEYKVYLNDIEIIGPIYTMEGEIYVHLNVPPYFDIFSKTRVFIKLINIFHLIETEINIRNNINEKFELLIESTDFTDERQKNNLFNYITNELYARRNLIIIDNEYYIYVDNLTSLFNSISLFSQTNEEVKIYLRGHEY